MVFLLIKSLNISCRLNINSFRFFCCVENFADYINFERKKWFASNCKFVLFENFEFIFILFNCSSQIRFSFWKNWRKGYNFPHPHMVMPSQRNNVQNQFHLSDWKWNERKKEKIYLFIEKEWFVSNNYNLCIALKMFRANWSATKIVENKHCESHEQQKSYEWFNQTIESLFFLLLFFFFGWMKTVRTQNIMVNVMENGVCQVVHQNV